MHARSLIHFFILVRSDLAVAIAVLLTGTEMNREVGRSTRQAINNKEVDHGHVLLTTS